MSDFFDSVLDFLSSIIFKIIMMVLVTAIFAFVLISGGGFEYSAVTIPALVCVFGSAILYLVNCIIPSDGENTVIETISTIVTIPVLVSGLIAVINGYSMLNAFEEYDLFFTGLEFATVVNMIFAAMGYKLFNKILDKDGVLYSYIPVISYVIFAVVLCSIAGNKNALTVTSIVIPSIIIFVYLISWIVDFFHFVPVNKIKEKIKDAFTYEKPVKVTKVKKTKIKKDPYEKYKEKKAKKEKDEELKKFKEEISNSELYKKKNLVIPNVFSRAKSPNEEPYWLHRLSSKNKKLLIKEFRNKNNEFELYCEKGEVSLDDFVDTLKDLLTEWCKGRWTINYKCNRLSENILNSDTQVSLDIDFYGPRSEVDWAAGNKSFLRGDENVQKWAKDTWRSLSIEEKEEYGYSEDEFRLNGTDAVEKSKEARKDFRQYVNNRFRRKAEKMIKTFFNKFLIVAPAERKIGTATLYKIKKIPLYGLEKGYVKSCKIDGIRIIFDKQIDRED